MLTTLFSYIFFLWTELFYKLSVGLYNLLFTAVFRIRIQSGQWIRIRIQEAKIIHK